MNKIISVIVIVIAIGLVAWYYVGNTNKEKEGIVPVVQTELTGIALTASKMVGMWQSTEDEKAIVVFNENGTTIDIYDGEELSGGSWELFEGEKYEGSGPHLKTIINGEEYDYAVWSVSDTELTINYLTRGNTLNYIRVVEDMTEVEN